MCAGIKTYMFAPLLKEAYSYEYADEPRYDHLIELLRNILRDNNFSVNMIFSWNKEFFKRFYRVIKERDEPE